MNRKKILKKNSGKLLEILYVTKGLIEICQDEAIVSTLLNVIYRDTKSVFYANEKIKTISKQKD